MISAVTGLLIFFDFETGLVEPVHKWLSWLLVSAIALHAAVHRSSFARYFTRKTSLSLMGAAALVTMVSVMPFFGEQEEGEMNEEQAVSALESTSLETVALVVKTTPEALASHLASEGVSVTDHSMTINEIARRHGREGHEVLASLLDGQDRPVGR